MADPVNPWDTATFELSKIAITALAGAVLGALTAAFIAAKYRLRDDRLKELRIIHASAAIAYGIAEAFVVIKRQHVKPLLDTWTREHARWETARAHAAAGNVVEFDLAPEFRSLTTVKTAVDKLREQMFSNIDLQPRAIRLVNTLDRSADQHTLIITEMNKTIAEYKSQQLSPRDLVAVYFGVQSGTRTDARYPSMLQGLYQDTDNCIGFGKLLGDELVEHWKRLAVKLPERLRGQCIVADFSQAERDGMMPDPATFAPWLAAVPVPPVPQVPTLCDRIKRALDYMSG
jgi:hypothetical protein